MYTNDKKKLIERCSYTVFGMRNIIVFMFPVLLGVFRYLDDISLWTAGNVCSRWRQILDAETSQDRWSRFIQLRWPLFNAQYRVKCWKTIYTKLLESAPCRFCLESMMLQVSPCLILYSWVNLSTEFEFVSASLF